MIKIEETLLRQLIDIADTLYHWAEETRQENACRYHKTEDDERRAKYHGMHDEFKFLAEQTLEAMTKAKSLLDEEG
jgi:hypothetical protein